LWYTLEMKETIVITCGGAAVRFPEFNGTKCRLELPLPGGFPGRIYVLNRLLRQLSKLNRFEDVILLLGYDAENILKITPNAMYYLMIKNPDTPDNLMAGIADFLEQHEGNRYTFILGDTVWHMDALRSIFKITEQTKQSHGIAYFSQLSDIGGETYAVRILTDEGNKILRGICKNKPDICSPFGNRHVRVKGKPKLVMDFKKARLNDLYSHLQVVVDPEIRKNVVKLVADIDCQKDYMDVWVKIKQGYFDLSSV
jgi:hypothetical protein